MSSKSIFGLAPRPNLSLEPTSSARNFHIRRLQDILQLSVQREDFSRAKRAWAILARCTEVDWITIWETGLSVIGKATDQSFEEHDTPRMGNRERLDYLKIVMLRHKPRVGFHPQCTSEPTSSSIERKNTAGDCPHPDREPEASRSFG
jgi:RNA polymerase I-specific transcription initiation factor Rrn11